MSRHIPATSRGRQTQTSSNRGRAKQFLDPTSQHKRLNGVTQLAVTARNTKVQRASSNVSDVESTSDEESSAGELDDEDGEDTDDDDDDNKNDDEEPESLAPSRTAHKRGGAGRFQYDESDDNLSEVGESYHLDVEHFGIKESLERDEELEKRLFESDDDDQYYEGVNEVSDSSDDDDRAIRRAETEMLIEEFDLGEASNFINDIDGLSAYGFGNESDGSMQFPLSPQGSDGAIDLLNRRVHFEENVAYQRAALVSLSDSPTMTRALLPSAMPESFGTTLTEAQRDATSHSNDDGYDTDATDQLPIPSQAFELNPQTGREDSHTEEVSPADAKERTPGRPPPVAGKFEDDGSKVAAFLDSTGRKLLLSDPQGVFARRCGPSAPASPSVGFEEAVFGESDSSQASMSPRVMHGQGSAIPEPLDLMLSGLNSGAHVFSNGQATGIPEAFAPPSLPTERSMAKSVDFLTSDFLNNSAEEFGESQLNLEDMITFGNDTDDESPTSPIYMPDDLELLHSHSGLAHLNNMNVTAFRRNADPSFAAQAYQSTVLRNNHFATPQPSRKRKADNDSPYAHSHYEGVTPVQRITEQADAGSTSPAFFRSKRRRTMNY